MRGTSTLFRKQIGMMIKVAVGLSAFAVILAGIGARDVHAEDAKHLRILFTHDIHSYVDESEGMEQGKLREHGDFAALKTLIDEYKDDSSIYVDGGDVAMGTLFQAGYLTDAYELRLLGMAGCDATTVGNHEWDHGGYGFAQAMNSACKYKEAGDPMPAFVQSNIDFSGDLTDEQKTVQDALSAYGSKEYIVFERGGIKIALFGLLGREAISDAPTSGMKFIDYIEAAKQTVADIKANENPDIIICLSHCGTDGDGENGEDFDLLKEVPDIDVVISAHSHDAYFEPVMVGDSILVSSKCYLYYLGCLEVDIADGKVTCTDYKLIPIDESVAEDANIEAVIDEFEEEISQDYLSEYGYEYDDVLAISDYDFMTLEEMYSKENHGEFPMGKIIADSYLYAARKNGVQVDVAAVGLGTIRDSIREGDITVGEAFEMCSLGAGEDNSAGHPIVVAYVTGSELALLAELDASLGNMVNSIKMSYAGMNIKFNDSRVPLDKITEIEIVKEDGTTEPIDEDRLYAVCINVYAANMIGMVNDLTKGILQIVPKHADGTPIEDVYECSIKDENGREVKEWVAFADYLSSFEKKDGVSRIPERYVTEEGRKVRYSDGGVEAIANPGASTIVVCVVIIIVVLAIVLIAVKIVKAAKNKKKEV